MNDRISVRREGRLGRITLSAGPLNVLGTDDLVQLAQAVDSLSGSGVIVLDANGRAFCAGMDIADHVPARAHAMLSAFSSVATAFSTAQPVTVAAVDAHAIGGGFELALLCDMIVVSENARFSLPEVKLAALPPVACALLADLVGRKRALDMILTGRSIDAATAERWGIASRCVPHGHLDAAVDELCAELLSYSQDALRCCKRAAHEKIVDAAIGVYEDALLCTHDGGEGIRAFLEKREPCFSSHGSLEATR
jgi:cyclohexa-1,5-dienecarbonyl-CoA hydratase